MIRMKTGFTLIELLVVIAIISILATILLPSLSQAKFLARLASCKSNMHAFGISFGMYANDHNTSFPSGSYWNFPVAGLERAFWGYQLMPYTATENEISPFFCVLSPRTESYTPERLGLHVFPGHKYDGTGQVHQTFIYLGNHSYDVQPIPSGWLDAEDRQLYQQGLMFPRSTTDGRAKVLQDSVSTYWFTETSHNHPNSLYSDGSIESGDEDPYSGLKPYVRPHGTFWY